MYEVVLEDEEGELTGFGAEEAWDENQAVEMAMNYHPHLNVVGVMKLVL